MQQLTRSLKIKISISILWCVLTLLISGIIAGSEYSGFSFGAFLIFSVFFNLPLLVYWLGFWIWGDGYIIRVAKKLFKFLRVKKVTAAIMGLIVAGIVIKVSRLLAEALGLGSIGSNPRAQDNLDAVGNILLLILACWAGVKSYRRIMGGSAEDGVLHSQKQPFRLPSRKTTVICVLYVAVILWVAYAAYDFSSDGIASMTGYGVGSFIGAYFLVFLVSKFTPKLKDIKTRNQVAAGLAIVGMITGNFNLIVENNDTHAFVAEMKTATPENMLQKMQSSKTKIGQGFSAVMNELGEAQTALANLDDERFVVALNPETLRDRNKISELLEIARQRKQEAEQAPDKIDQKYQAVFLKKEELSKKMPSSMQESFWDGVQKSYDRNKPTVISTAKAYADFYDSVIGLYSILLEQAGSYSVSEKSFVTFNNDSAVQDYNAHLSKLVDASDRIGKASESAMRSNQEALSKMQQER